ncbi:MAG TPA: T9SS type A sorting domain-containing protein [candidate division Zixibacteria bacterium]|nr:T9SS type A sorting domain-containing protein [candidate division Zixibacteria bacterium]
MSGDTYYYDYTAPIAGEDVHYYFQVGTDSTFSSQAPKNTVETFPPPANRIANIHNDPIGDHEPVNVGGTDYYWNNMDLVNYKMGYSDGKIYAQITTNGGFATSHNDVNLRYCGISPFGYWQKVDVNHIYAVPIINPLGEFNDSIFYGVLYADVNITFLGIGIVITPGVYKIVSPGEDAGISDYLGAYTKISNASTYGYNINGNVLNMWFDPSIIFDDPDFGDLPDENFFYTGAGIASAYEMRSSCSELVPDTFAYVVNDFSNNTAFYLDTPSGHVLDIVEQISRPEGLFLEAHPNPFNSAVSIHAPEGAKVEIFDMNGKSVAVLSGGEQTWRPEETVPSGTYLVRARIEDQVVEKQVVFLK